MLVVCRWCVEEILVPIVGAAGYCSLDCQEAAFYGLATDDDLRPGGRPRRRVRLRRRLSVPRQREGS
ncbi:hypothetical protein [Parafrankia discariae]|uniref:hypothetical protein n=1 Tax=Parafrankia discariae TaxID=365528 RepID=UPI000381F45A|nr:hypothetical protein [Parafrankia discariae]